MPNASKIMLSMVACLTLGMMLSGCSSLPEGEDFQDVPELTDSAYTYQFRVKDELAISIAQDPKYSHRVIIAEDGCIDLPYTGSIKAVGMSRDELRLEVENRLSRSAVYINPNVTVNVVASHEPRSVAVIGAVKRPVTVPWTRELNLYEALAAAQGTSEDLGFARPVLIVRNPTSTPRVYRYDIEDALATLKPVPRLQPGDVVIAQGSAYMDVERAVGIARNVAQSTFYPSAGIRSIDATAGE